MEGIIKKGTAIIVIIALITTGLIPPVTAGSQKPIQNNELIQSQDEDDHQDYYTIELYELKGFKSKKHTADVSYEDLMIIKDKLDNFEGTITEEMKYCLDLLTKQDVFTETQWKPNWIQKQSTYPCDSSCPDENVDSGPFLFDGQFIATFSLAFNFPLGFLFFAAFMAMIAGPSTIHYINEVERDIEYDVLALFMFIVMGLILVVPIFSPMGYINVEVGIGFGG